MGDGWPNDQRLVVMSGSGSLERALLEERRLDERWFWLEYESWCSLEVVEKRRVQWR